MPDELQLPNLADEKNKTVLYRIAIAQFAVSLVVTLILWVLFGFRSAYSAFLAGFISTLATLYVGWKFFCGMDRPGRERLASMYITELIKLVFLAAAFCISFIFLDVHFLSFIGAYTATVFIYWLAMIWPVFGARVRT